MPNPTGKEYTRHPTSDIRNLDGPRNLVLLGGCLPLVRVDRMAAEFLITPSEMLVALREWGVPTVDAGGVTYVNLTECVRQLFRLTLYPTGSLMGTELKVDVDGHPIWDERELDARVHWYMSVLPITRRKQLLTALQDLPTFSGGPYKSIWPPRVSANPNARSPKVRSKNISSIQTEYVPLVPTDESKPQ